MDKLLIQDQVSKCTSCALGCLEKNKFRTLPDGYVGSAFAVVGISPSSNHNPDRKSNGTVFEKSTNSAKSKNYELLRKMFAKVAIDFDTMWKTNAQKCAGENNDGEYMKECSKIHLEKELSELAPKLVFALGSKVGDFFCVNGKNITYNDKFKTRILQVYHPSYCTRGSISEEDYINQLVPYEAEIRKLRNSVFVNFHHHNHFSLRDGMGDEKDVAQRLVDIKSPGFCLTNHGNVHCHYRQFKSAKKYGMKPIFGTEFYYNVYRDELIECLNAPPKDDAAIQRRKELGKFTFHLTVVAKNEIGYYNLISMNNEALMNSFYKFPIMDDKLLEKYKEGLCVFSGCAGAYIPGYLLAGDEKLSYEKADFFKQTFKDDFYIELMSTKFDQQIELNDKLIKLSREIHVPTIITNDTHYVNNGDDVFHSIMLNAGKDVTLEDIADPTKKTWSFSVKDLFIKDSQQIRDDIEFLKTDNYTPEIIEESIDNIHKLFTKIEKFDINTSSRYPKLSDEDSKQLFEKLLKAGIEKRRGQIDPDSEIFKARLQEECDVIIGQGYMDYFIVLQDLINWCKKEYGRYMVGAGRGSAAASVVSYLLGITDVNPLKYDLMLFERFMSPGRKDPPDIDSDFSPRVRGPVIDYAINRFGRNKVFAVGTYGTIKLKTAIHDVLKALSVPYEEILRCTKNIPNDPELEYNDIELAIEKIPELKALFLKYPNAKPAVQSIRNKIRSVGAHAGGLVISGVDLTKTIPLAKTSTGTYVTANTEGGDYHEITEMGFVKYDILSLTTVDNVADCSTLIKNRWNIDTNWEQIQDEESKYSEMYSILHKGDSFGIFQFSSQLAVDYLKKLLPTDLNDLCAASGLIRPGPLDMNAHIDYALRKNGKQEFLIPPPIEKYMSSTFGILVYQEQFLRIVQDVCGLTKEEGSVLRKALVKYERSIETERIRKAKVKSFQDRVEDGFIKAGMSKTDARKWWDYIESFSRYGFNFAHSLSYAYQSYRQLWQKYYYTIEFYTSLFNNSSIEELNLVVKNLKAFPARKIVDGKIVEYRIDILPPDLRKMNSHFEIEGDNIRHGLLWTKYISEDSFKLIKEHLTQEDCKDLTALFTKKYLKNGKNKLVIDKKMASALIYSGALDYFGKTKLELAEAYNTIRKSSSAIELIDDDIELETLLIYYIGYNNNRDDSATIAMREKLVENENGLDTLDMHKDKPGEEKGIDIIYINKIVYKKTKKGKQYRLANCTLNTRASQSSHSLYVWSEDIKLKKECSYAVELKRSGNFIQITLAHQLTGDKK